MQSEARCDGQGRSHAGEFWVRAGAFAQDRVDLAEAVPPPIHVLLDLLWRHHQRPFRMIQRQVEAGDDRQAARHLSRRGATHPVRNGKTVANFAELGGHLAFAQIGSQRFEDAAVTHHQVVVLVRRPLPADVRNGAEIECDPGRLWMRPFGRFGRQRSKVFRRFHFGRVDHGSPRIRTPDRKQTGETGFFENTPGPGIGATLFKRPLSIGTV